VIGSTRLSHTAAADKNERRCENRRGVTVWRILTVDGNLRGVGGITISGETRNLALPGAVFSLIALSIWAVSCRPCICLWNRRQGARVLEINKLDVITPDVVNAARQTLVGPQKRQTRRNGGK
jgi:hypothetical protein